MNDFVSSKAMITPGVAGSATTTITGTLVSMFGLPGAETALVFSLIFGFMVFADQSVGFLYKILLYIISSMTIFSVAVGLNQSGMAITTSNKTEVVIERSLAPANNESSNSPSFQPFFQDWF